MPEEVLAAINAVVESAELIVFPGKQIRMGQRIRRWFAKPCVEKRPQG
ncbi:MAG: hypothetical protein ACI96M_003665 [Candidatus Azotimanducaceae bacterium]|jgi:hypothetical protein